MEITTAMIKELRDNTGAPIAACKAALIESQGDQAAAIDIMRKKAQVISDGRSSRKATEGRIVSYTHHDKRSGCLLEVNCESDFVANTAEFAELCHDLCLQIVASRPKYVRADDVSFEDWQKQYQVYAAEVPENRRTTPEILKQSLLVKMDEWAGEVLLMKQPFIRDSNKTVDQWLAEQVANTGENIVIRRFVLFELGETADA